MSFAQTWHNGHLLELLNGAQADTFYLLGGISLFVFCIAIPYLLGSINTAVLLSRLLYSADVRDYGSHNAGMTNMLRVFGKKAALFTLLGDVFKTALAVSLASFLLSCHFGGWIAGLFCMIGHIFPLYHNFKGGKGVLCAATAVLILAPFTFVCVFAVFVILVGFTKYVSLGSVTAALMLPLFLNAENVWLDAGGINVLISILMALLLVYCHRGNIKRLREGKESKLSFGKKQDGEEKKNG